MNLIRRFRNWLGGKPAAPAPASTECDHDCCCGKSTPASPEVLNVYEDAPVPASPEVLSVYKDEPKVDVAPAKKAPVKKAARTANKKTTSTTAGDTKTPAKKTPPRKTTSKKK